MPNKIAYLMYSEKGLCVVYNGTGEVVCQDRCPDIRRILEYFGITVKTGDADAVMMGTHGDVRWSRMPSRMSEDVLKKYCK